MPELRRRIRRVATGHVSARVDRQIASKIIDNIVHQTRRQVLLSVNMIPTRVFSLHQTAEAIQEFEDIHVNGSILAPAAIEESEK